MKFQILDIVPYQKNPVTGRVVSPADRLSQTVKTSRFGEEVAPRVRRQLEK